MTKRAARIGRSLVPSDEQYEKKLAQAKTAMTQGDFEISVTALKITPPKADLPEIEAEKLDVKTVENEENEGE